MARVDFVVPCYRYARFLRPCVESILSQSIEDIRVLIIDDASPDETPEVAQRLRDEDRRVEFVRHKANRGHIATYNEGLEWASADYTLLISADDVLLPGAAARAVALMDENPNVGFTYGCVVCFPDGFPVSKILAPDTILLPSLSQEWAAVIAPEGSSASAPSLPHAARRARSKIRPGGHIVSGYDFIKSNCHVNQVHSATAFVRTALQKKIGGYRPELPHAGDLEMWLRFAAHAPVGCIHDYQAGCRLHTNNMSNGYLADPVLDVHQRELVLNVLFSEYGHLIDRRESLAKHMYRGLAEAAVRAAGIPLSRGDQAGCQRLLDFASNADPSIRRSLLWALFLLKRRIGAQAWSTLIRPFRATALRLLGFEK